MVLACAERPAAASDGRAFDQNRQDQGSAVAPDRRGDQASRAPGRQDGGARGAHTPRWAARATAWASPDVRHPKKLVAVACHRVGVALDEGSRIRHKNRLTVRGLVKVLEFFAPGTDLLRRHHGGHEHRRSSHARDLYRTPQATARTFRDLIHEQ